MIYELLADADDTGSGGSVVPGLIILLIGAFLYFVPTIVAASRKVRNGASVFIINLFLGWTLIGGWSRRPWPCERWTATTGLRSKR